MSSNDPLSEFKLACAAKRFDEALEILDRLLDLDSQQPELWCNKGIVYGQIGQFEEALGCFQTTLELEPESIPALTNAAMACGHLEMPERAITYLDSGLRLAPQKTIYICTW